MIARLTNAVDSAGDICCSKDASCTTEFALEYSYLRLHTWRDSGSPYEVQSNTGNVGELLKSLSKCGLEVPDSVGEVLWRQLQVQGVQEYRGTGITSSLIRSVALAEDERRSVPQRRRGKSRVVKSRVPDDSGEEAPRGSDLCAVSPRPPRCTSPVAELACHGALGKRRLRNPLPATRLTLPSISNGRAARGLGRHSNHAVFVAQCDNSWGLVRQLQDTTSGSTSSDTEPDLTFPAFLPSPRRLTNEPPSASRPSTSETSCRRALSDTEADPPRRELPGLPRSLNTAPVPGIQFEQIQTCINKRGSFKRSRFDAAEADPPTAADPNPTPTPPIPKSHLDSPSPAGAPRSQSNSLEGAVSGPPDDCSCSPPPSEMSKPFKHDLSQVVPAAEGIDTPPQVPPAMPGGDADGPIIEVIGVNVAKTLSHESIVGSGPIGNAMECAAVINSKSAAIRKMVENQRQQRDISFCSKGMFSNVPAKPTTGKAAGVGNSLKKNRQKIIQPTPMRAKLNCSPSELLPVITSHQYVLPLLADVPPDTLENSRHFSNSSAHRTPGCHIRLDEATSDENGHESASSEMVVAQLHSREKFRCRSVSDVGFRGDGLVGRGRPSHKRPVRGVMPLLKIEDAMQTQQIRVTEATDSEQQQASVSKASVSRQERRIEERERRKADSDCGESSLMDPIDSELSTSLEMERSASRISQATSSAPSNDDDSFDLDISTMRQTSLQLSTAEDETAVSIIERKTTPPESQTAEHELSEISNESCPYDDHPSTSQMGSIHGIRQSNLMVWRPPTFWTQPISSSSLPVIRNRSHSPNSAERPRSSRRANRMGGEEGERLSADSRIWKSEILLNGRREKPMRIMRQLMMRSDRRPRSPTLPGLTLVDEDGPVIPMARRMSECLSADAHLVFEGIRRCPESTHVAPMLTAPPVRSSRASAVTSSF